MFSSGASSWWSSAAKRRWTSATLVITTRTWVRLNPDQAASVPFSFGSSSARTFTTAAASYLSRGSPPIVPTPRCQLKIGITPTIQHRYPSSHGSFFPHLHSNLTWRSLSATTLARNNGRLSTFGRWSLPFGGFPGDLGRTTIPPILSSSFSFPHYILCRTLASKKHKAILKFARGYRGRAKNCFTLAIRRVEKAWQYAYRDRRRKKRLWRRLWIQRLQAAGRQYAWRYSALIPALQKSSIRLNRAMLSELAANEPFCFKSVLQVVEQTTGQYHSRTLLAGPR